MKLFRSLNSWRTFRQNKIFNNKTTGFVPTMGNLHRGHESLLKRSVKENDMTVLSIFINPTQFNNAEDLKKYPRTLAQDLTLAKKAGVDFVLLPDYKSLYPDQYTYKVQETQLSQLLEGQYRPGHFEGMLTVVLKLLLLVKAHKAYFGKKDFQQWQLVAGMVKAFFIDTRIIACPIVRDKNQLALSSRNSRLSLDEYELALYFPKLLKSEFSSETIVKELENLGIAVDYVAEHAGHRLGAVKIANTRLLDNIKL